MADTVLTFPLLCFWQYCLYILSSVFIAVLPISFIPYIHWRAALIFRTLCLWLYEVLARIRSFYSMLAQEFIYDLRDNNEQGPTLTGTKITA